MSEERNSNDVEDKISIKEIHETFWRCRDFELSHLWQRSIFLSAFLILCFTGYGSLLITMLEKASLFAYANLLAFSIGVIGIIFSCLWIMMGKGSKAWYERYENAICAFERKSQYMTPKASHIGGFHYQNIQGYELPQIQKSFFKGNGGAYSPSKINIAIGQITLWLWSIIVLFHGAVAIWGKDIISLKAFTYIILIGGSIVILLFFCAVFYRKIYWLHSKTLNNE